MEKEGMFNKIYHLPPHFSRSSIRLWRMLGAGLLPGILIILRVLCFEGVFLRLLPGWSTSSFRRKPESRILLKPWIPGYLPAFVGVARNSDFLLLSGVL